MARAYERLKIDELPDLEFEFLTFEELKDKYLDLKKKHLKLQKKFEKLYNWLNRNPFNKPVDKFNKSPQIDELDSRKIISESIDDKPSPPDARRLPLLRPDVVPEVISTPSTPKLARALPLVSPSINPLDIEPLKTSSLKSEDEVGKDFVLIDKILDKPSTSLDIHRDRLRDSNIENPLDESCAFFTRKKKVEKKVVEEDLSIPSYERVRKLKVKNPSSYNPDKCKSIEMHLITDKIHLGKNVVNLFQVFEEHGEFKINGVYTLEINSSGDLIATYLIGFYISDYFLPYYDME
jgi:hypothetical protein